MHGQQNIKKVQLVFVAGCKGSSVRTVLCFCSVYISYDGR